MILTIAGVLLILGMFAGVTAGIVREGGWSTAAFAWGITLIIACIAGAGALLITRGLHQ
jgi:hypothetical protein